MRCRPGRGPHTGLLSLLFAAGLFVTGAAIAAQTLLDGQGNPVRNSDGQCIAIGEGEPDDPRCREERVPAADTSAQAPAEPVEGRVYYATGVPFEVDEAGLTDTMRGELMQLLRVLESYRTVEAIRIAGHTDASGSARYNQWLSEKRAESAYIFLRARGIDPRTTEYLGRGESDPLPDTRTPAENRRVEIAVEVTLDPDDPRADTQQEQPPEETTP